MIVAIRKGRMRQREGEVEEEAVSGQEVLGPEDVIQTGCDLR